MNNPENQGPLKVSCPTCKKDVLWNDDFIYRPFCSDRCRLIDLGEWASENHRIAGESINPVTDDENE